MNLKKTLFFAALLAVGLGYIFYVELPREESQARAEKLFGSLPRERIAEIEVSREGNTFSLKSLSPQVGAATDMSGQEPAQLASENGKEDIGALWQFGDLKGAALENAALTGVTAALAELKVGEPLPSEDVEGDLSVYGLDKPALDLTVKGVALDGTPIQTQLTFGKNNEFIKQRYVQVRQGAQGTPRIYLVPEALFTAANKPADDFRRKAFISFIDGDVQSVEISSGSNRVVVSKNSESGDLEPKSAIRKSPWVISESETGTVVPGSEDTIAQLFRDLRNARATQFIDGEQAADRAGLGLGEDSAFIRLALNEEGTKAEATGNGATESGSQEKDLTIRLHALASADAHGRGPGTYVSVSGLPFVIFTDQDLSTKVFKTGAELRDRAVFRVPTEMVTKVNLVRLDGAKIALQKSSAGLWTVLPDAGASADGAAQPSEETPEKRSEKETGEIADAVFVDEFLGNLTRLRAEAFPLDSRDFGLNPPRASVAISLAPGQDGSAKGATLLIGSRTSEQSDADFYAGVVSGDEHVPAEVFTLKSADVEKILPRREVLVPVPTPTPTPVSEESHSGATLVTEAPKVASAQTPQ